jgi:hypothetical protein
MAVDDVQEIEALAELGIAAGRAKAHLYDGHKQRHHLCFLAAHDRHTA